MGQAVSWEMIFEIVDDGWTTMDDGLTPEHGYPISSPLQPLAQVSSNLNDVCPLKTYISLGIFFLFYFVWYLITVDNDEL